MTRRIKLIPLPGWKSGCFPLTHKAKFEFLVHAMAVNFFDLEFFSIKTPFLLDCASYTDQSKVINLTVL